MFENMKWFNEPKEWDIQDNKLIVKTDKETDFWRKSFYGYITDNGHFFYQYAKGDFSMEVTMMGDYKELYDQGGLMIRVDEKNWVKTGIEYTDEEIHLSTVVTRDYSDWSMIGLGNYSKKIRIRITRHGEAIRIQYLDPTKKWRLVRLAYLDMKEECEVGVMCCSPQRGGFQIEFEDFYLGDPISRELHDDKE